MKMKTFFTAVDAEEEQGEEVKCFVLLLRQ
jgi:hypothetical protein